MSNPAQTNRILTGKIRLWDVQKGFGWLDADGRKIFLHWRDFAEKHKRPEVGDLINFEMGEDTQKRPCAIRASHVNDGGGMGFLSIIALVILLFLPVCALLYAGVDPYLTGGGVVLLSANMYRVYAKDKRRAKENGW